MTGYSRKEIELVTMLADHLQRIPKVAEEATRRGTGLEAEAMQIATGLADIQESSRELFERLVPRLLKAPPASAEAQELLQDIGEEYRHILYHIMDTKIFSYIVPEPTE